MGCKSWLSPAGITSKESRRLFTDVEVKHHSSCSPLQERGRGSAFLFLLLKFVLKIVLKPILIKICSKQASRPFSSLMKSWHNAVLHLFAAFCWFVLSLGASFVKSFSISLVQWAKQGLCMCLQPSGKGEP